MRIITSKTIKAALATTMIMAASTQANARISGGDFTAGIGFMERSDTGYGFIKGNAVVYQDEKFKHKLGLEFLGYSDNLDRSLDIDLLYSAVVANYELEYKANHIFSLYIGGGAGFQFVDMDAPVGSLDDDTAGYAQAFAGVRARLSRNVDLHVGVRRMFFDDHELLGVSDLKQKQTWGMEIGVTMRF